MIILIMLLTGIVLVIIKKNKDKKKKSQKKNNIPVKEEEPSILDKVETEEVTENNIEEDKSIENIDADDNNDEPKIDLEKTIMVTDLSHIKEKKESKKTIDID